MTCALLAPPGIQISNYSCFKRFNLRGAAVFSDLIAGVFSSRTKERIGTVSDLIKTNSGEIQAIVIDLDSHSIGKKVILSADRCWIDRDQDCVFAASLSRIQAEQLPEFGL